MIADPLNDVDCLAQFTAIAREGAGRADIKDLAARFASPRQLARWIRWLPQRDDEGDPTDGPRVACDVTQRARLAPSDPNCVERALLYLAAAEVLAPGPVRQLATIDVGENLRHTFPLEDGEPVVLDPQVRRNALRAGVWKIRNGDAATAPLDAGLDAVALLAWLTDLADDAAEALAGDLGRERVARARWALATLLDGRPITPRDRADVLYALRLAGDAAALFGEAGRDGYRVARAFVSRLVTVGTSPVGAPIRNVDAKRIGFWAGRVVATYYGLGGVYDAAYAEVARRPGRRPATPPSAEVEVRATAATSPATDDTPAPAVLGALNELETKKGA